MEWEKCANHNIVEVERSILHAQNLDKPFSTNAVVGAI
jgi:hypothetical protein